MHIKKSEFNEGLVNNISFMCIDSDNEKKKTREAVVKVIDSDPGILRIPDMEYSSVIMLMSTDLQETIRQLNAARCTYVTITVVGTNITYEGSGGETPMIIRQSESTNELFFAKTAPASFITFGKFAMAAFNDIIRCTNLSTKLFLCLDNNHPIIVKYSIGTIGHIQYIANKL